MAEDDGRIIHIRPTAESYVLRPADESYTVPRDGRVCILRPADESYTVPRDGRVCILRPADESYTVPPGVFDA